VVLKWPTYISAYGVAILATASSAALQLLMYRAVWDNVFLTILW
jgi:hypothetical protein